MRQQVPASIENPLAERSATALVNTAFVLSRAVVVTLIQVAANIRIAFWVKSDPHKR